MWPGSPLKNHFHPYDLLKTHPLKPRILFRECLLSPPQGPCFKFFLPWHCPLSGSLGQVFVYVTGANLSRLYYPLLKIRPRTPHFPSSFPPERFLRPHPKGLRLCFKFFLPWHGPLSRGLGQVFVYVAGARFARPNHIYKNLPRLYYPLLKIHPRTPHFPSSFPPERFLRPHPKGLRLCFKFFLPWHGPLSRGLGQVFVYVATNSTN